MTAGHEAGLDDWNEHWGRFADSASDNPAQAYRRRLVLDRLGDKPARLLDIGSGQGDLAAELAARFPAAEVAGVELSAEGVAVAQRKVPAGRFFQQDLVAASDPPPGLTSWASEAVCSEVLEHVDEPDRLLHNSRAMLGPGCRLVVTVPGGPMSAFDRHIGHRTHYTEPMLRSVLERAGFRVEECVRAGFPFFNLYRLLVVLRGRRLIDDVTAGGGGAASVSARLAMAGFRWLFRFNRGSSRWGWQLVATARLSSPPAL